MYEREIIDFFENYIKKYIVTDLLRLDEIKPYDDGTGACAIPQAISTFAAIDLLGYLLNKDEQAVVGMSLMGLLKNSAYFKAFNDLEVEDDFFNYFKDNIRTMLVHRFSLSKFDIVKEDIDSFFLQKGDKKVFNTSYFTKQLLRSVDLIYDGLMSNTLVIPGLTNEESLKLIHRRLCKLKENEKGVLIFNDQFPLTTSTQTTSSIG
jgi:hypothetical protein